MSGTMQPNEQPIEVQPIFSLQDLLNLLDITIKSLKDGYVKNVISAPIYYLTLKQKITVAYRSIIDKPNIMRYMIERGYLPVTHHQSMTNNEIKNILIQLN